MENNKMRFGKSQFMTTVKIAIQEEKKNHFTRHLCKGSINFFENSDLFVKQY